jgi:hypothetical protein
MDSYSTRTGSIWRLQDKATVRYGFEVETGWNGYYDEDGRVSARSARDAFFAAMEAKNLHKYVIAKSDASIGGEQGAEIVSRPLVFLEAKRVAKRVMDAFTAQPVAARTLSGCGVHVHTTRAAWSYAALLMAQEAVCTSGPNARTFWNAVATRRPNQYCERNPIRYANSDETIARRIQRWATYSGHYDAVSWSANPTIEFRMFGATTQARTLASYLDVVDALLRYCTAMTSALTNDSLVSEIPWFEPRAFKDWVMAQGGYQALKWRFKNSRPIRTTFATRRAPRAPRWVPRTTPRAPEAPVTATETPNEANAILEPYMQWVAGSVVVRCRTPRAPETDGIPATAGPRERAALLNILSMSDRLDIVRGAANGPGFPTPCGCDEHRVLNARYLDTLDLIVNSVEERFTEHLRNSVTGSIIPFDCETPDCATCIAGNVRFRNIGRRIEDTATAGVR